MNSMIRRTGFLVAAIAVLPCAIAFADSPTPCPSTARNHVIEITATHNSCEHAHVGKKADNKIDWYSPAGTTLTIVFDKNNVPYKHFGCGAAMHLPSNKCKGRNLGKVQPGEEYEYTASIDGKATKDPNIIINP